MSGKSNVSKISDGFDLPTPKPRVVVDPIAQEKFIAGDVVPMRAPEQLVVEEHVDSVETKRAGAPAPRKPKGRGLSRMRRDEMGERLTTYVDPDIAMELRLFCVHERRSVSDAVNEALRRFLGKRAKV